MFAKEYDLNFLPDDTIGKYEVKYHDVRDEPFRLYGVRHDGERFAIIKKTYDNARASGDENVYIINGLECFTEYGPECTVDGTHPNDFGYRFMAERISKVLKEILDK